VDHRLASVVSGEEKDVRGMFDLEFDGLGTKEPLRVDLRRLDISEDIDSEVDTAARFFAQFSIAAEKARYRCVRMKLAFENFCSDLKKELQKEREDGGLKVHSEAKLETEIRADIKYRAYKQKVAKFEHEAELLAGVKEAYRMRGTLIQTKAANRRNEYRGG